MKGIVSLNVISNEAAFSGEVTYLFPMKWHFDLTSAILKFGIGESRAFNFILHISLD